MSRKILSLVLFMAILAVLAGGCATKSHKEESLLFWPAQPEEPRILFVQSLRQEEDFRERSFLDALFGDPSGAFFSKPYGVFALDQIMYVTDTGSAGVVSYDMTTRKLKFFMGDKEQLRTPIGVAALPGGIVLVSDSKLSRIVGFNSDREEVLSMGKGELSNPAGIAVNNRIGRVYVTDSRNHRVYVYSFEGKPLFAFGQSGNNDGEFMAPTNIAVDSRNGTVYVVDTLNCRVQVFDKDGKFLRKFGDLGDTLGSFTRPKGIGIDSDGHVYVVDAAFNNFQVFDENGQLLMFIGTGGMARGQFLLPAGLYVDENDRIYVVEQGNQRIQIFQYLSEKWKQAHAEEYQKMLTIPAVKPASKDKK